MEYIRDDLQLLVSQPVKSVDDSLGLAGTHRGWDKKRLNLIGEGMPEAARLKTEPCHKKDDICDKQDDIEEEKYQADDSKPAGLERD